MRFILAMLAVLSVPVQAENQPYETDLPILCGDTSNILGGLKDKYDEEIVMLAAGNNATGDELFHSLWINAGTKTWSFVVVNKQRNVTCVIASGDNFNMFFPGKGI